MQNIQSRQNEKVKAVAELCADAALRRQQGLCVVHGAKLCREAVRLGCAVDSLWYTRAYSEKNAREVAALSAESNQVVEMSAAVCDRLSVHQTPQQILAVVRMPQSCAVASLLEEQRLVVLCDVQDPANVGAVLRTAAGLGFGGALLLGGCADPWSPKALRASMGASLALPVSLAEAAMGPLGALRDHGYCLVAAALRTGAVPITRVPARRKMALLIGSEGAGLPGDVVKISDVVATIPISDRVESFNAAAAAAILMWELRR